MDPKQNVCDERGWYEVLNIIGIVVFCPHENQYIAEKATKIPEHQCEDNKKLTLEEAYKKIEEGDFTQQDDYPPNLNEGPPVLTIKVVIIC